MAEALVTEASKPSQASVAPKVRTKYNRSSGPAAHMPMPYRNVFRVICTNGRTSQEALKKPSHSWKNERQFGDGRPAAGRGGSDTLTFHRNRRLSMEAANPTKNM